MRFLLDKQSNITPLIIIFLVLLYLPLRAQEFPPLANPPRLVNDYTNTLTTQELAQLEQKLLAYNDSTSSQLAIVMMRSTGEYEIADYAQRLGEHWGVGTAKDNGILILAAMEDRKIFIATGRGMEGAVPDALAKRIVQNLILPNFKMQSYFEGLDQATDMLFKLASGEYTAEEVESDGNSRGGGLILLIFLFIFVVLPLIKNRKDNDNHMGGKGGGVDLLTTVMLANLLRGSGGKFGGFSSGGGSFGGGGGFGGFGGGSFGGGGAGGSW